MIKVNWTAALVIGIPLGLVLGAMLISISYPPLLSQTRQVPPLPAPKFTIAECEGWYRKAVEANSNTKSPEDYVANEVTRYSQLAMACQQVKQ